ncbi:ras-related protein RAB7-like, partial [Trifolium pratense]
YVLIVTQANPSDARTFPFILLGNKIDIDGGSSRVVSEKKAKDWCASKGNIPYFETSAKEDYNVDAAFLCIAKTALSNEHEQDIVFSSLDKFGPNTSIDYRSSFMWSLSEYHAIGASTYTLCLTVNEIISRATNVVKYQPWRISVAGFWLSAMAKFVKDGDTTVPYSDVGIAGVSVFGSPPLTTLRATDIPKPAPIFQTSMFWYLSEIYEKDIVVGSKIRVQRKRYFQGIPEAVPENEQRGGGCAC